LEYAEEVGLDLNRFKKDMSEHVYASLIDDLIDESLKTGIDSGVEGRQLSLSMEYVMKIHGI
jgi:hypothetical protein